MASAASVHADPEAGNVTRDGFTVFWEGASEGIPEVRVFADEAGVDPLSEGVRRERFPLAEPVGPYSDVAERAQRRALRTAQAERGLLAVRVTGLASDTEYHVQAGTLDTSGAFTAAHEGLVPVRTAPSTPFSVDYRQVIVDFQDESAAGSLAVLRAPGALGPLVAVVGDSSGGAARARFSLAGLLDEATGQPLNPDTEWSFSVTHLPGDGSAPLMPGSAPHDGSFQVARATTLLFEMPVDVDIAEFVFAPIGDQMAGQPFAVTLEARDSAGDLMEVFEGTVTLESNGRLEAGATTASFAGGVLQGHEVIIGNTGDFRLTARHDASGAEGESELFAVKTDWENWMALYGDPEAGDSLRDQRLADPEGSGQPALMRYAFDLPFDAYETAPVLHDTVEEDGERYLTVRFRRLRYAPDVRYLVMASDTMSEWEVIEVIEPGTPEWVTVSDENPIGAEDSRFMRVGLVAGATFDFWRTGEFGIAALNDPEVSGKFADPGNHGVNNLERYALGMGGLDPDLGRAPERRIVSEGGVDYQELHFERLPAGEDVRYRVEATSDFPHWETIDEFGPGQPVAMAVRDTQPVPESGYRIMRLVIEEAP